MKMLTQIQWLKSSNKHIRKLDLELLRGHDHPNSNPGSGLEGVFDFYVFEFGFCSCIPPFPSLSLSYHSSYLLVVFVFVLIMTDYILLLSRNG